MSELVSWTSELDHRPHSWMAAGADDPWSLWVPLLWKAAADPLGNHPTPNIPLSMGGPGQARVLDEHAELLAWWAPLMHAMMFGLGWPRPDLAIPRWQLIGSPTDDPLLRLISRWWGGHLDNFSKWAPSASSYQQIVRGVAADSNAPIPKFEVEARSVFGDAGEGDPMHWHRHVTPMFGPEHWPPTPERLEGPASELLIAKSLGKTAAPRATLLLPYYAGWYKTLQDLKLPASPNSHGWRVDVVCKPLGWLGQYRKSSVSGRWFRGQHRWHALGI